ncbi:MAG: phosphoesterase [Thermoleophilia bacterium]|nr:phosphoesterase [Thermoleophilia bacterium]
MTGSPTPTSLLARLDAADRELSARIVVKPRADGRPRRWLMVLRRFSEAGSYGVGWVVMFAVVGIANDGVKRGAVAAALVVAMLTCNTLVKNVIRRPRPVARAIAHAPTTYSMPSAHSSMAMVGAATMQVIVPDQAILWWCVAVGLAISRVMLGMHYLADVVAGAALGIAVGLLVAAPIVAAVG